MKQPILKTVNGKTIKTNEKIFKILKPIAMKNWLFLYEQQNYNDAEYFWNNLQKASKGYGILINEPEWVEMENYSNYYEDWTGTVNYYMKKFDIGWLYTTVEELLSAICRREFTEDDWQRKRHNLSLAKEQIYKENLEIIKKIIG